MKKVSVRNRTSVIPSRNERAKFYNHEMEIRMKCTKQSVTMPVEKSPQVYMVSNTKTRFTKE